MRSAPSPSVIYPGRSSAVARLQTLGSREEVKRVDMFWHTNSGRLTVLLYAPSPWDVRIKSTERGVVVLEDPADL